jgi:hypothetical protein
MSTFAPGSKSILLGAFCMVLAPSVAAQVCNFSNANRLLMAPEFEPLYPVKGLKLDFKQAVALVPYRKAVIKDCSTQALACYVSAFSSLALPRGDVKIGDEWSAEGFHYQRVEDLELTRFGQREKYAVVMQTWEGRKIYLLLSKVRFLAGFVTVAPDGVVREMWLEEEDCKPFPGYEWAAE